MQPSKFGIYLHQKDGKVVRINSPHWIPSGDGWVYLTPDVNMTLLKVRELARERKLFPEPDKVQWS